MINDCFVWIRVPKNLAYIFADKPRFAVDEDLPDGGGMELPDGDVVGVVGGGIRRDGMVHGSFLLARSAPGFLNSNTCTDISLPIFHLAEKISELFLRRWSDGRASRRDHLLFSQRKAEAHPGSMAPAYDS